jgi:endonuclease I/chitodextrinase
MLKKLLSFYFLLFIYIISFSQESYYQDVDKSLFGNALKDALTSKVITTHTNTLEYTSSGPDVWDATRATDENPANTSEVVLFYGWEAGNDQDITNDSYRNKNLQDNGSGEDFVWNREHIFPKSLANPILDTDDPGPSTDAHHLRAADRGRNSARNNRKYGRGTGNSNYSNTDFHEGLDGPNTAAWYPGDQWKGDAARMIMYMYVRYGSICLPTAVGVGSPEFTEDEMIDLFLQWNAEDPVSTIEIARNTYHENTSNNAAQGNRNPFIDNPYLATRIWGGDSAEDRWDFYKKTDTEAPTTPTNVTLTDITFNSINISWSASSDNIGVTGYNIYVDDVLTAQTSSAITNTNISNLSTNTDYTFAIIAKDLINNRSDSAVISGATLEDTQAPSIPINLSVSNATDSSFEVSWQAATDNNVVTGYEIYVDNILTATTETNTYTAIGLNTETTYGVEIVAYDADNNKSNRSASINGTTTAGTSNGITELFISEYAEPQDDGNNKAIEIVNLTASTVNLSEYSIQKFSSSGWVWKDDYPLGNADIVPGDVFVIVHADTNNSELLDAADMLGPPNIDTSPYGYGSPLNFNGDDPIGLYKNGELIDVIGDISSRSKHIEDVTYRRKGAISVPNTTFTASEWDILDANTFDGIGSHTSTLSAKNIAFESFKMFPNPTNGNKIYFNVKEAASIHIYTVLGKLVQTSKVTKSKNSVDISKFSTGIYLLKINSGKQFITKKLIIN